MVTDVNSDPAMSQLRRLFITFVGAIGLTCVVVGLLLVVRLRLLDLDRRPNCWLNLKHIATSWKIYGDAYPESEPPILSWLVEEGYVTRDATICPVGRPSESNYVLVLPELAAPLDNRTVVAYEPKSNHRGKGGHVVFADGHAKFAKGDEYDRLVPEASARSSQPAAAVQENP